MFGLDAFAKVLKLLNKGASPNQLAGALALGFLLGLIPGWPLHAFVIALIILLLNVNLSMAIVAVGLGTAVAWLGDPLFHAAGLWLLEGVPALKPLWTEMYNNPIAMLTRFNNTVVMGSLAIGLLLLLPLFLLGRWLIVLYRVRVMERINKLKLVQLIKGSKLYDIYQRVSD